MLPSLVCKSKQRRGGRKCYPELTITVPLSLPLEPPEPKHVTTDHIAPEAAKTCNSPALRYPGCCGLLVAGLRTALWGRNPQVLPLAAAVPATVEASTTRDVAGSQKEPATSPLPSNLPAAPPMGRKENQLGWEREGGVCRLQHPVGALWTAPNKIG